MRLTKNERIEKILQVSTKIFARDGFKQASTKEIANLAGCTEGLIYKYFKTKEDILNDITKNVFAQNDLEYVSIFKLNCSFKEFLQKNFEWVLAKCTDRGQDNFKFIHRQEYEDPAFAKKVHEFRLEKRIKPIINECLLRQKKGEIKESVNCTALGLLIYELNTGISVKSLFFNMTEKEIRSHYEIIFHSIHQEYGTK